MSQKRRNNPHRHRAPALALAAACGLAAAPAAAEDTGWILSLGLQTSVAPSFPGSRNSDPTLMPTFDIRRADEPATFGAPDDDLSITLLTLGGISVGPLAAIRASRPNWVLPGLPGYSSTLEVGGFAEFWPLDKAIRARAELRHGVNGGDGFTGTLGLDWVTASGPFTFGIGPRLQFADATSMQTAFGVSAFTSAMNPALQPYTPGGGASSAGLAGSVAYDTGHDWTTTFFAGYDRLVGAAAASPITKRLDGANQFTIGIGLERQIALP
ncbi:MipA/OmpV family protein [Azorhizobium doebereinerae]|uniref:MipA/OmpV family protein n=1 Tax=Azorhizobium doebereinerae TaxID=281091 RepID=UPI0004037CF5|nr:MipA/OmpV family protein [Azorhizobium doebereinerae]